MANATLSVPDISCGHCERTIVQALAPLEGVKGIQVDIARKQVLVDYDGSQVSIDRLKEVLDEEAYPVASVLEEAM